MNPTEYAKIEAREALAMLSKRREDLERIMLNGPISAEDHVLLLACLALALAELKAREGSDGVAFAGPRRLPGKP